MKNMFRFSALLCAMALFVTSCTKDETAEPFNPTPVTGEIQFGARAGFEHAGDSRTVYSGEPYEVNGTKFQKIDWVNDEDVVQIYCAEAAGELKTMDYKVVQGQSTTEGTTKTFSCLEKTTPNALAWGSGTHTFYAMYPATGMIPAASTLAQGIKMDGTKLNGIVPEAQAPKTITPNDGNYICTPDMTYAYMAAKATAEPSDGSVSLNFVPIVTAVEIQLTLPSEVTSGTGAVVPVSIGEIQVEGTGIAGAFQADLASWTETYPTCVDIDGKAASNVIQISTWLDNKPITLQPGKSLTFTVFMRPNADITNLKVRISPSGAAYLGKELTGVTITKHVKTIIKNIYLPAEGVKIDASNWMSQLDPNTQIQKLSLPGTGGSFSFKYTATDRGQVAQQYTDMTIDEQWKLGIRAFEFACDRPDDGTTSLGGQQIRVNKTDMGYTIKQALTDLLKRVTAEGSEETAMAIITYQSEGTNGFYTTRNRCSDSFAQSLEVLYNDLNEDYPGKMILFKPGLTLGDAQGTLMIVCRINQNNEIEALYNRRNTYYSYAQRSVENAATNFGLAKDRFKDKIPILLINGCGTAKDRWGARGYKIKQADGSWMSALDIVENYSATTDVEYYLTNTSADWANVKVPVAANGDMNFGFETDEGFTCWYQEWARVVDFAHLGVSGSWYTKSNFRWHDSYQEKLDAVTTTFEMAINSDRPESNYKDYVFINSLCGYLVDDGIAMSYTPYGDGAGDWSGGTKGNIEALANKLNPAFYQYVLNSGMEQATGPTGIVLMDYVKATPSGENDGGYYLPGVIIANNFKFTANNNQSGSGSDNGNNDQQQPGGGNGDGTGEEG